MIDTSIPAPQSTIEQLDNQPSLLMGLIGGTVAMLISAIIWGVVSYVTNYQIGWMAIGVGFLVGIAVKFFGKGKSMMFGISSALLALIGCILGNLIFYSGIIAREESAAFLQVLFVLLSKPAAAIEVFSIAFGFMDILFYVLAAYVGFSTAMDLKRSRK
jgi:hypothetical protein